MSDRVSQFIVLCEDRAHKRLVRWYMKRSGIKAGGIVKFLTASEMRLGGNRSLVLDRLPMELKACRQRAARARTLLVVVIDADTNTVEQQKREVDQRLSNAAVPRLTDDDPALLLIPRRNVETWVHSLLGVEVNETDDYKHRRELAGTDFSDAARRLYDWAQNPDTVGSTCVPSLRTALPNWKRISTSA